VNCPDICPLTMHKLNKAMEKIKKMPEARFFDLKALFVSVDPDRDSNENIKK
jgi:cytochrome oxidase Cu insertion factor (SCO1/SenC/PrrC family)